MNKPFHKLNFLIKFAGINFFSILNFSTLVFAQFPTTGNGIYDYEGNNYQTIILENEQEWMAENLKSKLFSNGDSIQNLNFNNAWQTTNIGAFSVHNENITTSSIYGNLYNWYVTIDERNICPVGWHVPTDNEWTDYSDLLGGNGVAGGKMKLQDTLYWRSPNVGATNESFFSALPAGCRYDGGNYANLYSYAYWWSASQLDNQFSWYRSTFYNSDNLVKNYATKRTGYSIRCVKNQAVNYNKDIEDFSLTIFPNPFQETITINGEISNHLILIFDINGRLAKSHIAHSNTEKIDLQDFENGIYFIQVPALKINQKLIKH